MIRLEREPGRTIAISERNAVDIVAGADLVGATGHTSPFDIQLATAGSPPANVHGIAVQDNYFSVLGTRAHLGRLLSREDYGEVGPGSVVISDRLWRSAFGGSGAIIGQRLQLNAVEFRVVGVAAAGFVGLDKVRPLSVWIPSASFPKVQHRRLDLASRGRAGAIYSEIIARPRPAVSPQVVREQLAATMSAVVAAHAVENTIYAAYRPVVYEGVGIPVSRRQGLWTTLRVFMVVALFLFVVASINLGNLFRVRHVERKNDNRLMYALGATRFRVIADEVAEGACIVLPGALMGLALAKVTATLFIGQHLANLPPLPDVSLGWHTALFWAVCGGALVLSASVIPAVCETAGPVVASPTVGTYRSRGGRWHGHLIVQVAVSVVFLVGAGAMLQSVRSLRQVELGFSADGVRILTYDSAPQGYSRRQRDLLDEELLTALGAVKSIDAVGIASAFPFAVGMFVTVTAEGTGRSIDAPVIEVTGDYFAAVRTAVAGEAITRSRGNAPGRGGQATVISRAAAEALFAGMQALGQVVRVNGETATVVGVAGDVPLRGYRSESRLAVYRPISTAVLSQRHLVVRSDLDTEQLEALIRRSASDVLGGIPFSRVASLSKLVDLSFGEERLLTGLLTLGAAVSALLATLGLHGVLLVSVVRRQPEIAIKLALGARRGDIVGDVFGRLAVNVVVGLVVGVLGSYYSVGALDRWFFGVPSVGLFAYGAAAGAVTLLSVVACLAPVRRALAVQGALAVRGWS